MNDFLKRVVEGNGDAPTEICRQSFFQKFEEAINVEWFKKKDFFEVIFYMNKLEHIAIFNFDGVLLEYRLNIPADHMPESIKNSASFKGEIMNSVMRNKGNMLEYEVIVRDKELKRHLITFSGTGSIIETRVL